MTTRKGNDRRKQANRQRSLTASRTPLPTRTPQQWDAALAAKEAAREHQAITHTLLTEGPAQDILAYVLGMRALMLGIPDLAAQLDQAAPSQQSELVREALKDRERVTKALEASGAIVSPVDAINTPVGAGRTVGYTVGSEVERSRLYVLDHAALCGVVDAAQHLTPATSASIHWEGTGLEHGFMVFPAPVYIHDGGEAVGSMRAVSWAPGRTETAPQALRTAAWSQTYGESLDPTWNAVLEQAEQQQVALPRLTYSGTAWVLPPEGTSEVTVTPVGSHLEPYEDGILVSSAGGTMIARLALVALHMIGSGVLAETHVFTEHGREVHSLTLASPEDVGL